MGVEPRMVFLNSSVLGGVGSIERLFQVLGQHGFEVCDIKANIDGKQASRWKVYDPDVAQDFRIVYDQGQVSCLVRRWIESDTAFEVFLDIGWGEQHFDVANRSWVGVGALISRAGSAYSQLLLEVGTLLYNTLLPEIGWLDYADYGSFPWFDDLPASSLPPLHWANFYNSAWVERIGRVKLYSAPGWKVEALAESGCLYVLSSALDKVDWQKWQKVQSYWQVE